MPRKTIVIKPVVYDSYRFITDNSDTRRFKISAAVQSNGRYLSGLNHDEIKNILPKVISISPDSNQFDEEVKNYYNNINIRVPLEGLELEVGLDQSGNPYNYSDYTLYRYALVYSKVANKKEDIRKSSKIEMYIVDEEIVKQERQFIGSIQDKAIAYYLELTNNSQKRDNVLNVMGLYFKHDDESERNDKIRDLAVMQISKSSTDFEKQQQINKLNNFISVVEDKDLEHTAFIYKALNNKILTYLPNSSVITYEGTKLGNSIKEVIFYLSDSKNHIIKMGIDEALLSIDKSKKNKAIVSTSTNIEDNTFTPNTEPNATKNISDLI